jgi:LuxR family maltose regulon positive regulatory protein
LSGVLSRKLALVSAHAGAGKTTLISSWARTCPSRVIWVTLSSDDNDPISFVDAVATAMGRAEPLQGHARLNTGDATGSVRIKTLSSILLEAAASVGDDAVFVFDNFQVIESPAIHAALTALIDHMPKHVHVVIGTRVDPRIPLARLRSQGQLVEVRGRELEFSLSETREFLNTTLTSGVSHRDAELLQVKTQGWAAGLRLAVEAITTARDTSLAISSFGGGHPFVSDYFADEVLAGVPEEEQSFLICTSITDSFCASLCEALTGSGQSMLRHLQSKNLFLVPLDEQARWYRYHHCFAEVLARRLEEMRTDQIRELHLRAMRWYMQRGMMREVVHHALAAGEFHAAADAIEHQVNDLIWERGEIAGLLAWLAALPGEFMRSRPRLCLAHAWALALTGQLEALDDHLAIAEQSLLPVSLTSVSIPSLPVQQESVSLDPPILGELAAVRAVAAGSQFDTVRLEASSSEVIARDPENRFLRSVLALSRARALDIAANIGEAVTAYGEARALSESVGNSHVQIVASSRLAELWAVQGELHQSAAAHQSVLRMTEQAPERRSAIGAMSHVGLGSVLYEWNQLEDAARQFEEGSRQALRWGHLETLKGAYFGLARVRYAQGAAGDAFELLDEAEVLARHSNAPRSIVWVHAMQARLHVMQGNIASAIHWH